ncbi:MAG TPA: transcriptional repressor [Candidatus Omnitrophota bacterium]|jgi:Fur family ferric uptake transcriptional regulator|nr:transcriptional repressor [Candidatus Omnitrophota bacterium]HPN56689.1 transcriptional repressor [Candidatus Omnitrophota bacterium]
MTNAIQVFRQHVSQKGCHRSSKREKILGIFLKSRTHISAQELHGLVSQDYPEIGYTTVYRTLKLIADCGLAEEVDFNDGVKRYERKWKRDYHAHCICTQCGRDFEIFDEGIRDMSVNLAKRKDFTIRKLRYELFGVCRQCAAVLAGGEAS